MAVPIYYTLYEIAANEEQEVTWSGDGLFVTLDGFSSFTRTHVYELLSYGFEFGIMAHTYRIIMYHPCFTRHDPALLCEIRRTVDDLSDDVTRVRFLIAVKCLETAHKRWQAGIVRKDRKATEVVWVETIVRKELERQWADLQEYWLFRDLDIDPHSELVEHDAQTLNTFWADILAAFP